MAGIIRLGPPAAAYTLIPLSSHSLGSNTTGSARLSEIRKLGFGHRIGTVSTAENIVYIKVKQENGRQLGKTGAVCGKMAEKRQKV